MPYWIPLIFVIVLGALTVNTQRRALRVATMVFMVLGVLVGFGMAWLDSFQRELEHDLGICFGTAMRSPEMVRQVPEIEPAGVNFYAPLILAVIVLVLIFAHVSVMISRRPSSAELPPEYQKTRSSEEEFPPYDL